jgi:hypothetical protein
MFQVTAINAETTTSSAITIQVSGLRIHLRMAPS